MAILKVRETVKNGLFSPVSKRSRVNDVANFPKGCGSLDRVQTGKHEDRDPLVDHSKENQGEKLVKDDVNLEEKYQKQKNLHILHSDKQNLRKNYQHTPKIVSSKDVNHSSLRRKTQQLLDHHNIYRTSISAKALEVEVEDEDRRKVKEALNAYEEIVNQSNKHNCWSYIEVARHLNEQGIWVNTIRKIGSIRGVKVGDMFRHRAQLTIVGLHRQPLRGIDFLRRKDGRILATSIVDSGRYSNNMPSSDTLIYSGEGGNCPFETTEPTNQKLKGGNLALNNSKEEGTPIRVIRKLKLSSGLCYVYYGLYIVEKVMRARERGKVVYKFRLGRYSGQPKLTFGYS
ncbi:PREDICTED: YDG domain-containing protein At5g47150-like [Fragaria vesca subsp. vesca]